MFQILKGLIFGILRYIKQLLHLTLQVHQQSPLMEQGLWPNVKEVISQ